MDEKIAFGAHKKGDFYSTVKERVEHYFTTNQLSRYGNKEVYLKSFTMLAIYVSAYIAIISNQFTGAPLIAFYSLVGLMTGLMGFNFSHDVMHGSYFSSQTLNRIFSYVFDFNGTSSYVWKISHNQNHHIYTNIPGKDEDINKAILLRLSPEDPLYFFHRWQYLYAPILYALTSINWVLYSDYKWFFANRDKVSKKEFALFFLFKFLNLFAFLLLPLMVLSAPVWQIVLGFIVMHFTGGFTIAIIFQLAHVVEGVEFPLPTEGKIEEPWAEHEMKTTANFATESRFWAFWLGGLNFQIEHHLFSYVCHIHYPKISKIVKQTAKEFGLPYHEKKSVSSAIQSHLKLLKTFGRS